MLADGQSYADIQGRLQTTAPTISRWKKRFLSERLQGLAAAPHLGQKPTVITPKLQARVLEATRRKPKDGSTHWSVRRLAARELNLSKDTVHRIWWAAGIEPHRLERYMASDDPDFEAKAADIIELYLNPPQHAAVLCVDEKSAIQALDRLDPVFFRCRLNGSNGTDSNITVTVRYMLAKKKSSLRTFGWPWLLQNLRSLTATPFHHMSTGISTSNFPERRHIFLAACVRGTQCLSAAEMVLASLVRSLV